MSYWYGWSLLLILFSIVFPIQIDLKQIKAAFFQKYQKTLAKWIEQDTSGDYKKILIGIVGYDWWTVTPYLDYDF